MLYYYTQSELLLNLIQRRFDQNQIIDTKYIDYRLQLLANALKANMTKNQYYEWIIYWKAFYKQISEAIRINKKLRKTSNYILSDVNEIQKTLWCRVSELEKLRNIARMLMILRTASKQYARISYKGRK